MKLALAALASLAISGCTSAPAKAPAAAPAGVSKDEIVWRDWSNEAFAQARAEKKLVLLDIGTGWCHWCHVMDETTYRDAAVVALVREHFVALRVDADARLDLANRYEDYGWPGTIVFDAAGTELVKFRGYIEPARMASLLRAVVADPTPGPSARVDPGAVAAASSSSLDDARRQELLARFEAGYDSEKDGWSGSHKYLDGDSIELALRLALRGDAKWAERAKRTLAKEASALIDPVWGGAYQYSHGGDWENPHFEKIMARQACDVIAFSLAFEETHDPQDLAAARAVARFLETFLSAPDGAFYASMDADLVKGEHSAEYFALDDEKRRARGLPAIDRHVYARENGWAIEALCALHAASGDEEPLARATKAAERILSTHAVEGGGFKHDASDAHLYLGDTLAMGRACYELHRATGDARWLERAVAAGRFVLASFASDAGFTTARAVAGDVAPPRPEADENVAVARFFARLHRATDDIAFREGAERALRFALGAVDRRGASVAGPLLAAEELREEPLHVTLSGEGDEARALLRAALAIPWSFVVIERDSKSSVTQALLCGAGACRPPVRHAAALQRVALELLR